MVFFGFGVSVLLGSLLVASRCFGFCLFGWVLFGVFGLLSPGVVLFGCPLARFGLLALGVVGLWRFFRGVVPQVPRFSISLGMRRSLLLGSSLLGSELGWRLQVVTDQVVLNTRGDPMMTLCPREGLRRSARAVPT